MGLGFAVGRVGLRAGLLTVFVALRFAVGIVGPGLLRHAQPQSVCDCIFLVNFAPTFIYCTHIHCTLSTE